MNKLYEVVDRTHGACRECDETTARAIAYAQERALNGATGVLEARTPKGTMREHVVMVRSA